MPEAASEIGVQAAAKQALAHGGTNPWGRIREPLASAAGVPLANVRAIGMQDNSVITRAINSPGMTKANIEVHGFVVQQATDLEQALEGLRDHIRRWPNLRTAVVMPYQDDYRPTHVLTRDGVMGDRLRVAFPNAIVEDDIELEESPQPGDSAHEGPWLVAVEADDVSRRSPIIMLGEDEPNVRYLSCGDEVLLVDAPESSPRLVYGVGRVAALTRADPTVLVTLNPVQYFAEGPVSLVMEEPQQASSMDGN